MENSNIDPDFQDQQNQNNQQELINISQIANRSPLEQVVMVPQLCQPQSKPFKKINKQLIKDKGISLQVKQTIKQLHQQLNKEFKVYCDPRFYNFKLPQSKFPAVPEGQWNTISYEQKNVVQEEDTFRDRLSPQQIQQIRQDGQFKVRSNRQYITLPYIWKLNQILLIGRKNIENNWFKGISGAFSVFYNSLTNLKKTIPQECFKLKKIPVRIFSLIFGKKKMKTILPVDYPRQIAKQFWNQIMDKYYYECKQWGSQIWKYFYVDYQSEFFQEIDEKQKDKRDKLFKQQQKKIGIYYKQQKQFESKKQKLTTVHTNFMAYWPKIKKRTFDEVSLTFNDKNASSQIQSQQKSLLNKQKATDEEILEAYGDKKFTIYVDYLKQNLPKQNVPNSVIQSLITLITIFSIFNKKMKRFQNIKNTQNQKVRKQVKQKHKIKSLNYYFFEQKVRSIYDPIQKQIKEQFWQNLYKDKDVESKLNQKQKEVYKLWLKYTTNYQTILNAKKNQIKQIQGPSRTFYSTYMLLPPYKLIKNQSIDNTYYTLQKQKGMNIGTETNFWKFKLYAMRLKCWTINCVVFLLYCSWTGPFGLRCLYGKQQFRYGQYLANYQTGQIRNNMRKPVLAVFLTVLEGIRKSRQHFQALPDRGLFGKNLSRYFNYAQCYLFRFLITGVIITLILYPLGIIIASVLSAFFIITIWFWSPLILLVTYLFNILVFQFQSSYTPYGFFIRSFPLVSLVISILTSILKMLFSIIFLILIAPIVALFYILFSLIQRGFRTITDFIMITLISKLGRTPSRNTAIAKKISGPGMSRQFYMSITQEDVYILTQAQLQRIYMQQFDRVMRIKINQPSNRFNKTMDLFLKTFSQNYNYYNNNASCITTNTNQLTNNYSKTYQNYMARFPNRPYNVRFTQEELDIYLDNSSSIVKNFVMKKNIKNWMFQHFQILQDWDQLTRKVWVQIFQCGEQIFEPLQKIDARFKLEDQYSYEQNKYGNSSSYGSQMSMKKNVNKVMEALQGEVQLSHKRGRVSPFKHSLMNQQLYLQGITELVRIYQANTKNSVQLNLYDPKFLFCCHLNIKQLCKHDNYIRQKALKAVEK